MATSKQQAVSLVNLQAEVSTTISLAHQQHQITAGTLATFEPTTFQPITSQLEALQALCPVLLPSVVPHGYDDQDLWGILETEGSEQQEAFQTALRAVAKQRKQQSGDDGEQQCCVCGSSGQISISASPTQGEGTTLRFTTLPCVSFVDRTIHLSKAGFACGNCRALREPGRFLAFLGTATLCASSQKHYEKRQSMIAALSLHLAATNQQPEETQANPTALQLWTQEVLSRAYALQVLGSVVPGWKVTGPDGCPVSQATPGLSLQLLKALTGQRKQKQKLQNGSTPNAKHAVIAQKHHQDGAADGRPVVGVTSKQHKHSKHGKRSTGR